MVMSLTDVAPVLEDTATPAPVAVEAQPSIETPDLPDSATGSEAAPETVPAAPAPPDLNTLLRDLPDEEFEKLDRVSRRTEAARRQADAQARRQQAVANTEWVASGEFVSDLHKAIEIDDAGNPRLNTQQITPTIGKLNSAIAHLVMSQLGNVIGEKIPADYALPLADLNRLEEAKTAFSTDPRNVAPLANEWIAIRERLAVEAAKPQLRKDIEKEVRAEFEARAKTAATRAADEARATQPAPTRVAGGPGRSWSSQVEISTAHANGELTTAEVRELRASGVFNSLPFA